MYLNPLKTLLVFSILVNFLLILLKISENEKGGKEEERESFCGGSLAFNQSVLEECSPSWPKCYIEEPPPKNEPTAYLEEWPFSLRLLAYAFPQFHETPLNDRLWGKGYTEWTRARKVTFNKKGTPLRQPVEHGYYNLLSRHIRKEYGEISRKYGVYGFIYHHYWFNGEPEMSRPLEYMLEDNYPDTMFMLNWANEAWTKNWDGGNKDLLVPQHYGTVEDWDQHFAYLSNFFRHKNYIRVDGEQTKNKQKKKTTLLCSHLVFLSLLL